MALTTQDFTKGIDFTALLTANGSQHNQLIELGVPTDDSGGLGKGLVIATIDSALDTPVVPDAATTTKWKRYLWRRVPHSTATSQSPSLYAWSDNASSVATFLKWIQIVLDQDTRDQIDDNTAANAETRNLLKDDSYVVSITAGNSLAGATPNIRVWDYTVNFNRALIQNLGAGIIKCLIGGDYLISGFVAGYSVDHIARFERVDAAALLITGSHVVSVGINVNSYSLFNQPTTLVTNGTYRIAQYCDTVVVDGLGKANATLVTNSNANAVFAQINFKRLS